jgi:hypothetical protein
MYYYAQKAIRCDNEWPLYYIPPNGLIFISLSLQIGVASG